MEMDRQGYEQVKGLHIEVYKRIRVMKECVRSLQTENWCMDPRQSEDFIMTGDSELFQEYPE